MSKVHIPASMTPPTRRAKVKLESCTKTRRFAHRWKLQDRETAYVWARCRYCRKRRLFKKAWPTIMDHAKLRKQRMAEQRKQLRLEKKREKVGKKTG